jgi:WD40 repeat protein
MPHHFSLWCVNNDGVIRGYALPNMDSLCQIVVPTSPNCVALRPDGKIILSAGDSGGVFLHYTGDYSPVRINGNESEVVQLVTGDQSGAFSCAWHPQGTQFAVSSTHGHVTVWNWDLESSGDTATLASAAPVCVAQLDAGYGPSKLPINQPAFNLMLNLQTNRCVPPAISYPARNIFAQPYLFPQLWRSQVR